MDAQGSLICEENGSKDVCVCVSLRGDPLVPQKTLRFIDLFIVFIPFALKQHVD